MTRIIRSRGSEPHLSHWRICQRPPISSLRRPSSGGNGKQNCLSCIAKKTSQNDDNSRRQPMRQNSGGCAGGKGGLRAATMAADCGRRRHWVVAMATGRHGNDGCRLRRQRRRWVVTANCHAGSIAFAAAAGAIVAVGVRGAPRSQRRCQRRVSWHGEVGEVGKSER